MLHYHGLWQLSALTERVRVSQMSGDLFARMASPSFGMQPAMLQLKVHFGEETFFWVCVTKALTRERVLLACSFLQTGDAQIRNPHDPSSCSPLLFLGVKVKASVLFLLAPLQTAAWCT